MQASFQQTCSTATYCKLNRKMDFASPGLPLILFHWSNPAVRMKGPSGKQGVCTQGKMPLWSEVPAGRAQ